METAAEAGRSYAFYDEEDYNAAAVVVEDQEAGRVLMRVLGPIYTGFNFNRQKTERRLDAVENLQHIHLVVDSPGGFLDGGVSIYQMLNSRRKKGVKVTAMVEGLAASAAVMPLLAADDRQIEPGSKMMTHRPWTGYLSWAIGHADELNEANKRNNKYHSQVVSGLLAGEKQLKELFVLRTNMTKKEADEALGDTNTWYSAEEAVEAGLVTAVAEDGEPDDPPRNELNPESRSILAAAFARQDFMEAT